MELPAPEHSARPTFMEPGDAMAENNAGVEPYEPQKLNHRHHKVLQLAATGVYTNRQIAALCGYTEVAVGYIVRSKLGQAKLAMYRAMADGDVMNVQSQLLAAAPLALQLKLEMMIAEDTEDKLRDKIAGDVLDRAGYGAVNKNLNVNQTLSADDLHEIKNMAQQSGLVVHLETSPTNDDSERERDAPHNSGEVIEEH